MKDTFTKNDLRLAFLDGLTAGIALRDGTFGEEDFMGGPAAEAADKFVQEEWSDDWESLWRYCGGSGALDGPPSRDQLISRTPSHIN